VGASTDVKPPDAHRRKLFSQLLDADPDRQSAREDWRRARLRSAAEMVIVVNPAFEATRYQPIGCGHAVPAA
jgi:hypothetical protein